MQRSFRIPCGEILDVLFVDDEAVDVPQTGFEQHADGVGEPVNFPEAVVRQFAKSVDFVRAALGLQIGGGAEGVLGRHQWAP